MTNLLAEFNRRQIEYLNNEMPNKTIPKFRVGDNLKVITKVDNMSERTQVFEGLCIARRNNSLHSSFTLRKISHEESVVSQFFLYSPMVISIEVTRLGKVRRAKLYYVCKLFGKAARIKERKVYTKTKKTTKV